MIDLSPETIKALFYAQVRKLTRESLELDLFDYQFSDRWF